MVFTLDKLEINVMTGTLGWGRNWGELGQEGQMSPIWAGTRVSLRTSQVTWNLLSLHPTSPLLAQATTARRPFPILFPQCSRHTWGRGVHPDSCLPYALSRAVALRVTDPRFTVLL